MDAERSFKKLDDKFWFDQMNAQTDILRNEIITLEAAVARSRRAGSWLLEDGPKHVCSSYPELRRYKTIDVITGYEITAIQCSHCGRTRRA